MNPDMKAMDDLRRISAALAALCESSGSLSAEAQVAVMEAFNLLADEVPLTGFESRFADPEPSPSSVLAMVQGYSPLVAELDCRLRVLRVEELLRQAAAS